MIVDGRARVLGDDVNTDYIIASTRKRDTLDEAILKQYLLEAIDPGFAASVRPGDLLVAGRNFGCGSAMEVAATVIAAAGIRAVIAESFSRTFYRNAVNNGLVPIQCETRAIQEGERLIVQLEAANIVVTRPAAGAVLTAAPLSGIMVDILACGGLVPYLRANGRFRLPAPWRTGA